MENKKKTKGISLLLTLLLMGFLPLTIATIIVTAIGITRTSKEVKEETYEKLKIAAESVNQYFAYDIIANGDVDYEEYADHGFIESAKTENVEMTLFKGDIRLITSLKKEDGSYNEGSAASPDVYAAVSSGKTYESDDVVINGVDYYVYYEPVFDGDGAFWGMAFAGTPQEDVKKIISETTTQMLLAAFGVAIIFGIIITILAIRIRKSIIVVRNNLLKLASGDLSECVMIKDAIVEITESINATNELQQKLSGVIGTVKGNTNTLIDSINTVHASAGESANGTEQIASAMDELANATMSLSENIADVNTQAQSMGEYIQSITENVSALSDASEEIKESTENAQANMNKVMESSEQSSEAVFEIGKSIALTNESIEKITEAVTLISDIADQTNLLSLNASIEAARAGEAGRGFAVVAEEIGKLSQESAASAEAIRVLAEDMKAKSADTVELAGKIETIIGDEQQCVKSTQTAFESLGASIEESLAMIAEIDSKTVELVSLKEGIISNISDLSAISEETAASNEEVTASVSNIAQLVLDMSGQSDSMSSLSTDLEGAVAYFK